MARVLLVRVECLCGTVAAFPEGGYFPLCGRCGRRMVLPSADRAAREQRALGYLAELVPEIETARSMERSVEAEERHRSRQYADEDLRAALVARGWPVEAPSDAWPTRTDPAGARSPVVPWECS